MRQNYVGNAPYCFTNSLVMLLGDHAPPTSVVETLTGSPFGFQLLAGKVPLFDPYGWDPDLGLDQAITLLGLAGDRVTHSDADDALAGMQQALAAGPVLVGPMDMGLLAHQPGSDRAAGADHFVVATSATASSVTFHDPQGHPYAALPTDVFLTAWRADAIGYLEAPYAMRTGLHRVRDVSVDDALHDLIPLARQWCRGTERPTVPHTIGGVDGYVALAELLQLPGEGLRSMLADFSIRVGARRRGDAAHSLHRIGHTDAARCLEAQASALGALQYAAVTGDNRTLSDGCLRLAELHTELLAIL